ncbi:hypothetical protein [Paracraurococcus ruber]|nr:hypothetical protein [Paracraurococcus ruber]
MRNDRLASSPQALAGLPPAAAPAPVPLRSLVALRLVDVGVLMLRAGAILALLSPLLVLAIVFA